MPLKISRSIIRVAERVLGITGTPLPTEVLERVQLSLEARAIRDWELFDEGIVPWYRQLFSGAVVAELSYVRLSPRLPLARREDLVVLTHITLSAGETSLVRVNSTGVPDLTVQAIPRDTRISSTSPVIGVDVESGAEAAVSGTLVALVPNLVRTPFFWASLVSSSGAIPSNPNLTFWKQTVNQGLDAFLEGVYISAKR